MVDHVRAAYPTETAEFLRKSAQNRGRAVRRIDFLGETYQPLTDATVRFTPGVPPLAQAHEAKAAQVDQLVNQALKLSTACGPTRAAFFSREGSALRLNTPFLLHLPVSVPGRQHCGWCGVRSASLQACSLCGETVCSSKCFLEFHSVAKYPAVTGGVSMDADLTQTPLSLSVPSSSSSTQSLWTPSGTLRCAAPIAGDDLYGSGSGAAAQSRNKRRRFAPGAVRFRIGSVTPAQAAVASD